MLYRDEKEANLRVGFGECASAISLSLNCVQTYSLFRATRMSVCKPGWSESSAFYISSPFLLLDQRVLVA
jgi:hypothetical protein